jgi:hypothetical protein
LFFFDRAARADLDARQADMNELEIVYKFRRSEVVYPSFDGAVA